MHDEPLVAVVVVHYGSPKMTIECLESICTSHYTNLRIIVVDNCPGQRLSPLPSEMEPSVAYILNSTNTGYCGGNNAGIIRAQSLGAKYLLIINNDTIVDDKLLAESVSYMESHQDVAVISPKILFYQRPLTINVAGGKINGVSGQVILFGLGQKDCAEYDHEADLTFLSGCAFFARATIFDQIGMFDEKLFCYGEDVDLSCRLALAGMKIRYFPRAKVWHRHLMGRIDGKCILQNAIDVYYDWRNRLYNVKRYFSRNQLISYAVFSWNFLWTATSYAIEHRRLDLCRAMFLGVADCFAGRMGERKRSLSIHKTDIQ